MRVRVLGLEAEGERGLGCFRGLLRSDMSLRLSAGEKSGTRETREKGTVEREERAYSVSLGGNVN